MQPRVLSQSYAANPDLNVRGNAQARSQAAQDLLETLMEAHGLVPWRATKGPYGNPLPNDGWHTSKSHCSDRVAVALGLSPIGVDVETIRFSKLAHWPRVIDEREKELLGDLNALTFTRLWTAKEAVLKADGIGIGGLSKCRLLRVLAPDCLELGHNGHSKVVHQEILDQHVVSVYAEGSQGVSWDPC